MKKSKLGELASNELLRAVDAVLKPRFSDADYAGGAIACYDADSDQELELSANQVREHIEGGTLTRWLAGLIRGDDREALSALDHAALGGHLGVVRLLIDSGDEEAVGQTFGPLAQAAQRGDVEAVRELLGSDLSAYRTRRSRQGGGRTAEDLLRSALGWAAQNGQAEVVRELMKRVPDVHKRDDNGPTALSRAAHGGHLEAVRVLIGTEPGLPPELLSVALTAAVDGARAKGAQGSFLEVIELLSPLVDSLAGSEARKRVSAILEGRRRPEVVRKPAEDEATRKLLRAAEAGNVKTVKKCLRDGADVNGWNKEGYSVLHLSIGDSPELVRLLVEAGADVHARARSEGATPLHMAARRHAELGVAMVGTLCEAGADANVFDDLGRTPLDACEQRAHFTSQAGFALVMAELVRRGAHCGDRPLERRLDELRERTREDVQTWKLIEQELSKPGGPLAG